MKTTTTQHTPGPWTAGQQRSIHNLDYTHCVWGPDGDSICNCNSVIGPNEANARLIAAAPELLEALTNLLEKTEKMAAKIETCYLPDYTGLAINQARSALARVQGKEAE